MSSVCVVCDNTEEADETHNLSPLHRFNCMLWDYNNQRDHLFSSRHGVELSVNVVPLNGFEYNFTSSPDRKGCYHLNVTPEMFHAHQNKIDFLCTIQNKRTRQQDPIVITYAGVLHPYEPYSMQDPLNNVEQQKFIEINAGASYEVKVKLELTETTVSNFKIPIYFTFQTLTKKKEETEGFSISRSIIVAIHNEVVSQEEPSEKSPFTSQKWEKVTLVKPTKKLYRLPDQYPIPHRFARCLWYALGKDFGDGILQEILDLMEPGHVTLENYRDFFSITLWLEEMCATIGLGCYNMENVNLTVKSGDILVLEVPGLAEKRPSVIVGDLLDIKVHGDHTAYQGVIKRVGDKTVDIENLDKILIDTIRENPGMEIDVRFVLGRIHFERMHQGINQTVLNNFVKNLFPDESLAQRRIVEPITISEHEFFNAQINYNKEQRTAVSKIVNNTSKGAPYIVFGPPGTGKTVTIVEAIYQLKRLTKHKILVCAPANAACNMLAERLSSFCNKSELKRIISETCEVESIHENIKEYCNLVKDPDGDVIMKVPSCDLKKFRIVVTTLVLAGKYTREYHPDVVFIDEAAQAREPEACCAIGLLQENKQLVLAGDPKQLGPSVMSKICQKYGYDISILERIMELPLYKNDTKNNFMTMLKLNFRSHTDILRIPNEVFYDNQLEAVSASAHSDPIGKIFIYKKIINKNVKVHPGHPTEFCSVLSKERREGRSPSYYNPREVLMVYKYVEALTSLSFENEDHKVTPNQIGVVTPYIRQMYKIKEILKQHFHDVEVGTTEAFQGREKRIMIVSTVRAQEDLLLFDKKYKLGFVKEPKRFNVALTRAMSKLIIIGNPIVLIKDDKFRRYIELCEEKKSFGGAPFQRRTDKIKQEITTRVKNVKMKDSQYRHNQ